MTKAKAPAEQQNGNGAHLILFGLDQAGKPRAARLGSQHADLAAKAAGLMGLRVCNVTFPQLAEVAKKLPPGRLYENGRGLVPHVRRNLYAKLLQTAGIPIETSPEANSGSGSPPATPPGLPRGWDEIAAGHLVIAQESRPEDGWWEAIVLERSGDMLTLRWRDYPKQPTVSRHVNAVALLNPAAV